MPLQAVSIILIQAFPDMPADDPDQIENQVVVFRAREQVVAEVRENFGELVYETMIPRTVRLSEAPSYGEPILYYDKRSKGTDTYMKLVEEVMAHGK